MLLVGAEVFRAPPMAGAAQLCGDVGAEAHHIQRGAPPADRLPACAHRHHQGAVHIQAPGKRHVGETT